MPVILMVMSISIISFIHWPFSSSIRINLVYWVVRTIHIWRNPNRFLRFWIYSIKPPQCRIHQSSRVIIKIKSSFGIQFLTVVLVRLLAGCGTLSKRHPERIIMITLNNTSTGTGTGYHTIITQMVRQVKIVCAVFNFRPSAEYVYVFVAEEILSVCGKFNTLYEISLILLL